MACSNCFNGCADVVSDQCVKYTGPDIPGLGIVNGDTLLTVEQKITDKILTLMDGTGIIPIIDPLIVCDLVKGYLPCCPPLDINVVLTAVIKSICAIDSRVTTTEETLAELNSDYTIECLTGVVNLNNTHEIVQAIITKVCQVEADLEALALNVEQNFVKQSEILEIVQTVIDTAPGANLVNNKMIPFVAYPYWGPITKFGITGAGFDEFIQVFLCNGINGTPDLRGRVVVGVTVMGNPPLDTSVDPATPNAGNPNYTPNMGIGNNKAQLTDVNQLPPHSHNPMKVVIDDPTHTHQMLNYAYNRAQVEDINETDGHIVEFQTVNTQPASTGLKGGDGITTVDQNVWVEDKTVGNMEGHDNIQPVRALYYIMYIPS